VTAAGILLAAPAAAQAPAAEMVVSTAWLAEHLKHPDVAVIAVVDADDYVRGHIPGARRVSHDVTLAPNHRLAPADRLARIFAEAGARDDARIVLYGDSPMETGWIYMALASLGHAGRVSLLSGNLSAWIADGHPVSKDAVTAGTGTLTPRPAPDVVVDAPWVRARLDDASVKVIDARTTREWNNGRLPGATLVLWQDLYQDTNQMRFKPREEIRALLVKAGVIPGQQVVTYCAIGMRASLMYFAARYAGYNARVYVGSWQDWSARSGYPIVR
jgi:thiosulfate/3-mercaptopyruvate sulfurtransferase